ncbi:dynamin, putative [Entamoeba invadens IP1]|uniref:Dynamin, putative n=1 Tax=Entamoeba invadens IP1 TaxID=370355 RepID=A0A0A1UHD5_ENTIV|nr:dynamin, putative [Entamoeba invadens IP1]ELP95132.1 dynamin, putative [Entamoeba invadens IP1]|eukprot:XP_004261903.1 dynamin, putative [Entamoeba invadens IP1]
MQRLIPVINSLQDVFTAAGLPNTLPLPQIVVVGSQSSGKSSVLEHIVGKDFLPRGSGIVTRRPLIVQCVRSDVPKEYGLFEHTGDKRYFDFSEIRDEIAAETARTCPGRNVSSTPIRLRIHSPNVVDLTLVDLPGLVKVSVVGQAKELVKDLRDMVYQYAAPENALILAVTSGNVDIANSDALHVAKEVDPDGERTIGVLTKLDLEDKGTNSMDVLMGRVYPLKLGYIGVVNRSQQDINNGMDVQTSLKNERKYFEDHPVYCSIADRMGTEYLVNKLNTLLLQHIQKCLPTLRSQINESFEKARKRYDEIKPDDDNLLSVSLQQIMKFSTSFSNALSGNNTDIHAHELAGGAKIFSVFETQFRPNIDSQDILANIKDVDILTAIKNASGTRPCLYVPQTAFENLIAKQVKNFEGSCHQCVDSVYSEMKNIVAKTAKENIEKYDRFREALVQASTEVMNTFMTQAHKMIQDIIDIEADYVNTSHPDFDTTKVLKEADEAMKTPENMTAKRQDVVVDVTTQKRAQNMQPQTTQPKKQSHFTKELNTQKKEQQTSQVQPAQQNAMTSSIRVDHTNQREMREIELIRNLSRDYLLIVRKSIKDLVPKAVIHFLVFKTRDSIQKELIKKMYNETLLQDLLAENPALVSERKVVKQNLDALKQALDIINNVRDKCF